MRALVVPGSARVKAQAEAEGLDKIFTRGRRRVAAMPGCSMCLAMNPDQLKPGERSRLDLEPQFRRPAGQGRAHASGEPRNGRRGGRRGAFRGHPHVRRRRQMTWNRSRTFTGHRWPAGPGQRRYGPDHPEAVPEVHRADGLRPRAVLRLALSDGRHARSGVRAERPAARGRLGPGDRNNFGCGSSREHAVWAVQQYGFKAVIAPWRGEGDRSTSRASRTSSRTTATATGCW